MKALILIIAIFFAGCAAAPVKGCGCKVSAKEVK